MKFVHLSDTHVLLERPQENQAFNAALLVDDGSSLRTAIQRAKNYAQKPDAFFLTGDLVHEGGAEDYRYLKKILDEACDGTPYFVALGNHDRREAFWEGFYGETGKKDPYVASAMLDGLRIISLDTSPTDGSEAGEMPEEQLAFLKAELAEPAPMGSVILLHHPQQGNILEGFAGLCPVHDAFHGIIRDSGVRAVLSGHTHNVSVHSRDGVLYATAASTAFTMDNACADAVRFVDACDFNIGRITADRVYVGTERAEQEKTLYTMTNEAMAHLISHGA